MQTLLFHALVPCQVWGGNITASFHLAVCCDVTNYNIFLFRVIQPTQPNPTISGLWEIRPCDSLVGFGRLEVSFYCENVILCENVKNAIFPIKSNFQHTQLLQGRMANRAMTVGLGWVGWMTLNKNIL